MLVLKLPSFELISNWLRALHILPNLAAISPFNLIAVPGVDMAVTLL